MTAGCGKLAGLDEYAVGQPSTPACDEGAVRIAGACVQVGIPPDECAASKFVPNDTQGCDPILPEGSCPGQLVQPGNYKCVEAYNCASSGYSRPIRPGGTWYVRAGAPPGGDGSLSAPYRTISEALSATTNEVEPNILIGDGEYHEHVVITHDLLLSGDCPLDTGVRLVPTPANEPAVTFTAGAGGAEIDSVLVRGGTTGVLVDGAAGVTVGNCVLQGTDGPGLRLDDRKNPAASVTINADIVDGALGAGVLAYGGGGVTINQGTIRGTRDAGPGKDACGVCMRASGVVPTVQSETPGATYWDARQSARPSLTITGALIENNSGAGVSVIGANATITRSVVRSTRSADGPRQRVGIDVSERSLGAVPASLVLTQSDVEGTTAIGVRGHDATISIDRSVIRDIGGGTDSGTKRCLGNGVRARWDHDPDPAADGSPTLNVENSVIERTHETGILVEGGSASVRRSIVRDTAADPCAGGLGDGIAAYALPNVADLAPASLMVEETRVDGSARAGILAFDGAQVTVKSSALVRTGGLYLGSAKRSPTGGAYCASGAATDWTPCEPAGEQLDSSLLGGAGCDPDDDTFCYGVCGVDAAISNSPNGAPGLRWWSLDHDEVAPVVTDPKGCVALEGLPRNREVTIGVAPRLPPAAVPFNGDSYGLAYSAGSALNTIFGLEDDQTQPPFPLDQGYSTLGFFLTLLHGTPGSVGPAPDFDFDLSDATDVGIWVCAAHPELAPPGTDVCRDAGRAVGGVEVSLDPPLDRNAGPYYADGAVPVVGDTHTPLMASPLGALVTFLNVPPGERNVVLKAADIPENAGKKLDCTIDSGRGYAAGGWPAERTPNVFRIVVSPAQVIGFWAYCSLD